ncbi:hypothetical protein ACFVP3_04490 [Streptomyces sp. NPDC057806]|uniref:hypothetical protein n=1 Tax=Streptomyces sp. NPDC057806 TaxID=3346255 RepID=UPI00367860EF
MRRITPLTALCVLGLALSGCVGDSERAAGASAAATAFERLLSAEDGTGLCAALAPETRSEVEQSEHKECAEAITAQDLPEGGDVRSAEVYGRQARVVLEGDTLFLSRFPDGWKIVAAGCTPRPERPYDCVVEGG